MTNTQPSNSQPAPATLDCPSCGHSITYYDVADSCFYGCPHCHAYFDYSNDGPPDILMRFPKQAQVSILPLGSEGYIGGQMVRVTGYMHRKEEGTNYDWREYMLLRPDGTTIQLAEYEGHWTLIEPVTGPYTEYKTSRKAFYVDTEERQYRLYNRYRPETLVALGEFDWNVLDDKHLTISEYINPPYVLVSERTGKQSSWYLGEYQSPQQVATAFGLTPADLPGPIGTGAIEPAYQADQWNALLSFTGLALVVLFACQLLFLVIKPRRVVLDTPYSTEREAGTVMNQFKPVITKSFEISGPSSLAIRLSANIDNQWVELPVSLVNEQTGQSYEFSKVLEYYHGYEGGENWSEGDQTDNAELSRIPSGRYHLNLYPASEMQTPLQGKVRIVQNPMMLGNLLIVIGLLALYPIYLYIKRKAMESSRWQNSDFADEES